METRKGLKIKYNRISSISQSGNRYELDKDSYDLVMLDKISGTIPFKERPKGKELVRLIEKGEVCDLVVEEFSRLGRNTGDVIKTLEWLEENEINVTVRNIGLQSRPKGEINPIWKMISAVMSSLYEEELAHLKNRTAMGKMVYLKNGGVLGRPCGSTESEKQFLEKPKTKEIIKWLCKGRTIREIASHTKASNKTILKAKKIGNKYGLT